MKIQGQSGKMTFATTEPIGSADDKVQIQMASLQELAADGTVLGGGGNAKHSFNSFATQDFTFGAPEASTIAGVERDEAAANGLVPDSPTAGGYTAKEYNITKVRFTSYLGGGDPASDSALVIESMIFQEDATLQFENPDGTYIYPVIAKGTVKFNVVMSLWNWCANNCKSADGVGDSVRLTIEMINQVIAESDSDDDDDEANPTSSTSTPSSSDTDDDEANATSSNSSDSNYEANTTSSNSSDSSYEANATSSNSSDSNYEANATSSNSSNSNSSRRLSGCEGGSCENGAVEDLGGVFLSVLNTYFIEKPDGSRIQYTLPKNPVLTLDPAPGTPGATQRTTTLVLEFPRANFSANDTLIYDPLLSYSDFSDDSTSSTSDSLSTTSGSEVSAELKVSGSYMGLFVPVLMSTALF